MNDLADERMRTLLREAIPPLDDATDAKDLWPAMRSRMRGACVRISMLDWALVAALCGALLLFPRLIPGLLYHL